MFREPLFRAPGMPCVATGGAARERGPAIQALGLARRFGDVEAVRGIDLEVAPGEAFGFLGPNGAGKSTTLNMLCTLTRPSAGSARVAGFDVVGQRDEVRRHIGLVFQDPTLDVYLSAEQNLRFHAELYGVPRAAREERIETLLHTVGLWERRRSLVRTFSGGMRRRLEIARGLLHAPRVLFLDEPTIGLDPQTRTAIWNHVRALQRRAGITVFMTTHYMEEAEFCDRIAIIDAGRIVACGSPAALKAAVGQDRVRISTADDLTALAILRGRFGLDASQRDGMLCFAVADGERFVPHLFAGLGVPIRAVSISRPSLDDVFIAHTGASLRDADAPRRESALAAGPARGRLS
jgi:ABC-2 type transport system ATP-binding protein